MDIYWNKKDIPALKGLTPQERTAAIKPVIGKVWRHWQVWLPFLIQIGAYIVFFFSAPYFPYRLPIVIVVVCITAKIAGLPFNHYLNYYLSQGAQKS